MKQQPLSIGRVLKLSARVLGMILLAVIIFVLVCGITIWFAADGLCGNQVSQEINSPDHQFKAVVYQRDCGATTGFSTQISILKASAQLPNEPGNIFAMDGHPDWSNVKVVWKSNDSVTITYPKFYDVFFKENKYRYFFKVITVEYQQISD